MKINVKKGGPGGIVASTNSKGKCELERTALRLYGANGYMVTNSTGACDSGASFDYIWISTLNSLSYTTCDLPTGELNP